MEQINVAEETEKSAEGAAVKTIDRAARLLTALARDGDQGTMLSDLARRTGLGKGTVHRLLGALSDVGYVTQDAASRRYRLGVGLELLSGTARHGRVAALASPLLERIASITADTAFASVQDGLAAVCVGREVGSFPIRTLSLDVGNRRPLGVGSGSLALLAFLPDADIDRIIAGNQRWLAEYPGFGPGELSAMIAETRRYGFSFNDGRVVQGMNAVGVPVLDMKKRPIAALSVAAIAERLRGDRIAEVAALLQQEAAELAALLRAGTMEAGQRTETPAAASVQDRAGVRQARRKV
ncbi:IclR family transcriptional regulator [Bradyrhizobium sp. STM 3557]|uniref:IclR family transcriptional regulator n=1 Tax=Bradyrhizobium sp. STM 3557 TaxID=578920 RepID=UPI00388D4572